MEHLGQQVDPSFLAGFIRDELTLTLTIPYMHSCLSTVLFNPILLSYFPPASASRESKLDFPEAQHFHLNHPLMISEAVAMHPKGFNCLTYFAFSHCD